MHLILDANILIRAILGNKVRHALLNITCRSFNAIFSVTFPRSRPNLACKACTSWGLILDSFRLLQWDR